MNRQVNICTLKRFALEKFPPDSILRTCILAEPDLLNNPYEFFGKISIYLRLLEEETKKAASQGRGTRIARSSREVIPNAP